MSNIYSVNLCVDIRCRFNIVFYLYLKNEIVLCACVTALQRCRGVYVITLRLAADSSSGRRKAADLLHHIQTPGP